MSHVLKISCQENHNHLNKEMHRFWNLDAIGISPNESSVYEKFENNIKFKDNRYSINKTIKERLVKDEMISKQDDEII